MSDEYSRLLLALKAQGLIQDFCVDNKQENYYRITKKMTESILFKQFQTN